MIISENEKGIDIPKVILIEYLFLNIAIPYCSNNVKYIIA